MLTGIAPTSLLELDGPMWDAVDAAVDELVAQLGGGSGDEPELEPAPTPVLTLSELAGTEYAPRRRRVG